MGSLKYMGPEQISGGKIDKSCDIYSLGIILYELFSGDYPYNCEKTNIFKDWQDIHCNTSPIELTNPKISPQIAEITMQCLKKNPKERPQIEKVLKVIGNKISGIGVPSYIGILGSRGSGKTCYLISLYHNSVPCDETKKILEQKYINLYQKCLLPSPTELSTHRLNFGISTQKRFYDIVTKDYGGELLAGRYEEDVVKEFRDSNYKEKQKKIYEFFQASRGIVIIVETNPIKQELQKDRHYINEIDSLISKISKIKDGNKKIEVPVALVLSKWDRIDPKAFGKSQDELRESALQYIKNTNWLPVYTRLKNFCNKLEVYPIFSFIADKPSLENIKPFNICQPLIWITEMADKCLFNKCKEYQLQNPQNYKQIIKNFWNILNVENITDAGIRKKIEIELEDLSQLYFEEVEKKIKKYKKFGLTVIINLYKEIYNTNGVSKTVKEKVNRKIQVLKKRAKAFHIYKTLACTFSFLLFIYLVWEVYSVYSLLKGMNLVKTKELRPLDYLQGLQNYKSYETVSPLRKFGINDFISHKIEQNLVDIFNKELRICNTISKREIAKAPLHTEKYGRNDLNLVVIKIENSIEKINLYTKTITTLSKFQKRWALMSHYLAIKVPDYHRKIKQLKNNKVRWKEYLNRLEHIKKWYTLRTKISNSLKEISRLKDIDLSEDLEQGRKEIRNHVIYTQKQINKLKTTQKLIKVYLKLYPNSPFFDELNQAKGSLKLKYQKWKKLIKNFIKIKKLYESLPPIRSYRIPPSFKVNSFKELYEKQEDAKETIQSLDSDYKQWLKVKKEHIDTDFAKLVMGIETHLTRINLVLNRWKKYLSKLLKQKSDVFAKTVKEIDRKLRGISNLGPINKDNIPYYLKNKNIVKEKELMENNLEELKQLNDYLLQIERFFKKEKHQEKIGNLRKRLSKITAKKEELYNIVNDQSKAHTILYQIVNQYPINNNIFIPTENDSIGLLTFKKNKNEKIIAQYKKAYKDLENFLTIHHKNYIYKNQVTYKQKNYQQEIIKLEDINKKIDYFKHCLIFKEIEKQGREASTKQALSPYQLELQIKSIKAQLDRLNTFQIIKQNFLISHYYNLKDRKQKTKEKLEEYKQKVVKKRKYLIALKEKIEDYTNNWQDKVKNQKSYRVVIATINELLLKTDDYKYLDKYKESLKQVQEKIIDIRKADIKEYQTIKNKQREHYFIDTLNLLKQYNKSTKHFHIMNQEIAYFLKKFGAQMSVEIYVTPKVDDPGGGEPDLKLYFSRYITKYKKGTFTCSKKEIKFRTKIGTWKFNFIYDTMPNFFDVKVIEMDPIADDNYGTGKIRIRKLFNNKKVLYSHKCGSDGTIFFELIPKFDNYTPLPDFDR